MRRLLFLTVLVASVVDAAGFTSCTFEGATKTSDSGCEIYIFPPQGRAVGEIGAAALIGNYVSRTQLNLNADGNVEESSDQYFGADWNATAKVNNSLSFASSGSKRAGFVQFDITTRFSASRPDLGQVLGDLSITDGVHHYTYQNSVGSTPAVQCSSFDSCEFAGTLPFNLGSAFQVFAVGDAEISDGVTDFGAKSDGGVSLTLSLLEADGKTAVQLFVTPEPSTWGLSLLGLSAFAFLVIKKAERVLSPGKRSTKSAESRTRQPC